MEIKMEEEKQIKNELHRLNSELDQLNNELNTIQNNINDLLIQYEENSKGALKINIINQINGYLGVLKQKKELKKIEIDQKKDVIQEVQDEYISIRQEKMTYEKLKEKYYERYREEELKKEQKIIDEISNNMHFRRN